MSSTSLPRVGEYYIIETLGIGSFGKVKLGSHVKSSRLTALKFINRSSLTSEDMNLRVEREIKFLKVLRHPHIIRLYEIIHTPSDIVLAIEYAKYELFDFILEKGRLSEPEARRLFQQLIAAIEHCHSHSIVHRDLKPENILLDEDFNLKLGDFGLSNVLQDGDFLKTSCGSPNYAAPEVILGKLYAGPEVDVWSCGAILYVMLVGKLPFDDDYIPVLFQKIMEGIYTIPSFLSEDAKHLITSMLKVNALERITISDIRRHPFFVKDLPAYLYPYLSFDAYGGESVIELVARQLECSTTHVLTQLCMNGDNPIKEAYSYYLDNPNVITSFLQSSQSSLSNSSSSFSSSLLGTVSYAPSMDTSLSKSFSSTSPSSSSSSSSSSSTSTTLPSHTCNFTATPPTPPFAPSLPAQPLPATHTEFTKSSNFSSADNAEPLLITPHLLALNSSGCLDSDSTAVSNLSNTSPFVSATSTTPSSVINSNSALSFFPSPPFPIPPTEKWHLGLRSQSSPHDIMCVIYQVLVEVGMEWKVIGPYHLSARPCVSPLSSTTFSTTTPSSHKNLPPSRHYPTIEIQLFKEDANWYFMDFKFIVAPFSPISRTSHIVCTGSSMPSISSSSNTSISSSTVPSSSPSSTPSHSTSNSNFSSNESLTMDTQKSHFCKVIHVFGFIKIVSILIQRLKHESPSSSSTSPFSLPTSSPPPPFPPINISMT